MNNFSTLDLEAGASVINFLTPYSDSISSNIKSAFDKAGAVFKTFEREGYCFEYCEWHKLGDKEFTLTLTSALYSVEGDKEVIAKIENALIESGLFQKIIA